MEVCEGCYAADSQRHQGHEFARLTLQRVTDVPDDEAVQINNWWRRNFPGCNLGMSLSPISVALGRLADKTSHWSFHRVAT